MTSAGQAEDSAPHTAPLGAACRCILHQYYCAADFRRPSPTCRRPTCIANRAQAARLIVNPRASTSRVAADVPDLGQGAFRSSCLHCSMVHGPKGRVPPRVSSPSERWLTRRTTEPVPMQSQRCTHASAPRVPAASGHRGIGRSHAVQCAPPYPSISRSSAVGFAFQATGGSTLPC